MNDKDLSNLAYELVFSCIRVLLSDDLHEKLVEKLKAEVVKNEANRGGV